MDATEAAAWLRDATGPSGPEAPVAWTYRPLEYAWDVHAAYLARYQDPPKKALLVGMNPGPWGMGQTGVPFGDPVLVGDWLGLRGVPVGVPPQTHPKRPVLGWASTRREQSGRRLWGHLQERFGTADAALRDLLVVNHCPLLMFDDEGRNVTPDKLPRGPREALLEVCDEGLRRMAKATRARCLVAVGRYAQERCLAVAAGLDIPVASIPHPSPASPIANRDGGRHWRVAVDAVLTEVDALPRDGEKAIAPGRP